MATVPLGSLQEELLGDSIGASLQPLGVVGALRSNPAVGTHMAFVVGAVPIPAAGAHLAGVVPRCRRLAGVPAARDRDVPPLCRRVGFHLTTFEQADGACAGSVAPSRDLRVKAPW